MADYIRVNRDNIDELQLMTSCHSMPLYSIFHKNINIKEINCAPGVDNELNIFRKMPLLHLEKALAKEKK